MTTTLVRQHTRRKPSRSPVYIAKHESLRADVAAMWAQRSERANTPPVVKVEVPVAYVSPGIFTNLASTIRGYIGRGI